MSVIKFSHNYPKLHGQTSAELIAVRPIHIDKDTPEELLEYDTTYYEMCQVYLGLRVNEKKRFPLPEGDYVQLIFLGNLHIPFCTIRKNYPPQKADYYTGKIGDIFEIRIKPDRQDNAENEKEIQPHR